MKPQCCRECIFLKLGKGETKFYRHRMYECAYELPELPKLPASVEHSYTWRSRSWPPEKALMAPQYGVDCKTFARR
jgi:hypothetical protein